MEGKRFRRIQNGCIYEVIGREETPGQQPRWILWNEKIGKQELADDFRLNRQVGWEIVGAGVDQESVPKAAPISLMKKVSGD